jgi:hypothetical protein
MTIIHSFTDIHVALHSYERPAAIEGPPEVPVMLTLTPSETLTDEVQATCASETPSIIFNRSVSQPIKI